MPKKKYTTVYTKLPLQQELDNFSSEGWTLFSKDRLEDSSFLLVWEMDWKDWEAKQPHAGVAGG